MAGHHAPVFALPAVDACETHVLDDRLALHADARDDVAGHDRGLARDGEPSQREIARRLGWSERTLQLRLRDEETSFAQLLDEVRAGLARMHLEDSRLAVFEVAFLLGFSEPSAFNRAFRRWTGKSPRVSAERSAE